MRRLLLVRRQIDENGSRFECVHCLIHRESKWRGWIPASRQEAVKLSKIEASCSEVGVIYFLYFILVSIYKSPTTYLTMAKPEDSEENWIEQLDTLCSDLNVDPVAAKKSKESFLEIKRHYTLDVSIN